MAPDCAPDCCAPAGMPALPPAMATAAANARQAALGPATRDFIVVLLCSFVCHGRLRCCVPDTPSPGVRLSSASGPIVAMLIPLRKNRQAQIDSGFAGIAAGFGKEGGCGGPALSRRTPNGCGTDLVAAASALLRPWRA